MGDLNGRLDHNKKPKEAKSQNGTRAIAKELDLSRNTVKNALRSDDPPAYKRKTYTNPELKPFQEYIIEQYFVKKLKGSRVLNDLRSKGCKVSSSAFYRYIQQYKTVFTRTYMRYETKPGEQGQFDWSPYTVMIEDKPIKIQVFCFILGCSRYRTYMYSFTIGPNGLMVNSYSSHPFSQKHTKTGFLQP
ncbi:MAG: hypothetical protein ACT6FF_07305 [Methanosarcinaceae archaeon]